MTLPSRPAWKRKRPAPRATPHAPKLLRNDDITWTRIVQPREQYRVVYVDRDGERSERVIDLQKIGNLEGTPYAGVTHAGQFKTFRVDRIIDVLEQITTGHDPSLFRQPTYSDVLPKFPVKDAVFRVPTVAKSNRSWTVNLNLYTCTCPEKRIRGAKYVAGQLGFVCPHMARAIVENLPEDAGWETTLVEFLRSTPRVHIDNLV